MAQTLSLLSLTVLLLALTAVPSTSGLSWPTCDDGGSVWVTERPHTEPTFPGADLMFFCEGGLNVLGTPVSPCVNSGSACTAEVADAVCTLLGFDASWGDVTLAPAQPAEAVKSLTGEFCLRQGLWASTEPADVQSLPGSPCQKIDKLTCIRYRETMVGALASKHLISLHGSPATEAPTPSATNSRTELSADAGAASGAPAKVQAASGPSGRKLLH